MYVYILVSFWLCKCYVFASSDISAPLSLHQYLDGRGPPEGGVVCLTAGLLDGEDPALINSTNLLQGRQGLLMGLARSGGSAAAMSWFIQMTAAQTWEVCCLLISTTVLNSYPAQPQARATSSTGSEVVMSHTVGSHSTSHCGRLHWQPWLPA